MASETGQTCRFDTLVVSHVWLSIPHLAFIHHSVASQLESTIAWILSSTIYPPLRVRLLPQAFPIIRDIRPKMCYQVVERYAACRCIYHQHNIDPCPAYGQRGHLVQERTVLVGHVCPRHSSSATRLLIPPMHCRRLASGDRPSEPAMSRSPP